MKLRYCCGMSGKSETAILDALQHAAKTAAIFMINPEVLTPEILTAQHNGTTVAHIALANNDSPEIATQLGINRFSKKQLLVQNAESIPLVFYVANNVGISYIAPELITEDMLLLKTFAGPIAHVIPCNQYEHPAVANAVTEQVLLSSYKDNSTLAHRLAYCERLHTLPARLLTRKVLSATTTDHRREVVIDVMVKYNRDADAALSNIPSDVLASKLLGSTNGKRDSALKTLRARNSRWLASRPELSISA